MHWFSVLFSSRNKLIASFLQSSPTYDNRILLRRQLWSCSRSLKHLLGLYDQVLTYQLDKSQDKLDSSLRPILRSLFHATTINAYPEDMHDPLILCQPPLNGKENHWELQSTLVAGLRSWGRKRIVVIKSMTFKKGSYYILSMLSHSLDSSLGLIPILSHNTYMLFLENNSLRQLPPFWVRFQLVVSINVL